ncbi:MAG: ABC transporter substrate-binding protein, partial [Burkholderiaceae bacterium]
MLTAGAALAATPQTQARSARAQSPTPKTLRVCFQTAETGFDPAQTQDYYSNQIISHIFDAPLRFDFLARPVKLIPNTAASLPQVSADFRTFTVRLT